MCSSRTPRLFELPEPDDVRLRVLEEPRVPVAEILRRLNDSTAGRLDGGQSLVDRVDRDRRTHAAVGHRPAAQPQAHLGNSLVIHDIRRAVLGRRGLKAPAEHAQVKGRRTFYRLDSKLDVVKALLIGHPARPPVLTLARAPDYNWQMSGQARALLP